MQKKNKILAGRKAVDAYREAHRQLHEKLWHKGVPEIGDVCKGTDLGKSWSNKLIWAACDDCGKRRWVGEKDGKPRSSLCRTCGQKGNIRREEQNPNWKGGRTKTIAGYILIKLQPNDPFYPMAKSNSCVLEHRLIVAKALGRCLHRWEIIHHKHDKYPVGSIEDKQDNRYPENLQLVSDDKHKQITVLEMQITDLQKQVRLLKFQVKELNSELMKIKGDV